MITKVIDLFNAVDEFRLNYHLFKYLYDLSSAKYLGGSAGGSSVLYFKNKEDLLNYEYFNIHSRNKILVNPLNDDIIGRDVDNYNKIYAQIILNRFKDKWDRLYETMVESTYDTLNDYMLETNGETLTKKDFNELVKTLKNGSTNDNITEKLTSNSDIKEGTSITTTDNSSKNNSVYGFNSVSSVNSEDEKNNTTTEVVGDKTKNTTETINTSDKSTNKDSTTEENNNTDTSGSSNTTDTVTTTTKGLRSHIQDIIKKEIDLRLDYNFYKIIYRDIDSILTLEVY